MRTVTESWDAVETWLATHAPGTFARLRPPADPAEIAAAEERLGLMFPPALVESLTRHNGGEWSLLPGVDYLDVAMIVSYHEMRMDDARLNDAFTPAEGNPEPWWHPQWLPFADENGNMMVLDLRPGPGHARIGIAYNYSCGRFTEDWGAWPDLPTYLDAVATGLTDGTAVRRHVPLLHGLKDATFTWGDDDWIGTKTRGRKYYAAPPL